jgi:hypothetical protein
MANYFAWHSTKKFRLYLKGLSCAETQDRGCDKRYKYIPACECNQMLYIVIVIDKLPGYSKNI